MYYEMSTDSEYTLPIRVINMSLFRGVLLHALLNAPRLASCPSFGGALVFLPLKQVKLFKSANFPNHFRRWHWDYFQIQLLALIFEFCHFFKLRIELL